MIDKAGRFTISPSARCAADDCLVNGGEDFDALLAASSLGSEQAIAIRVQAPASACEHAQRVLDGQEKCAPVEGDIDDAVGGLVNGLARRQSSRTAVIFDDLTATFAEDLLLKLADLGQGRSTSVILAACQADSLAHEHRIRLLEALIDHDAFAGLRPDVAWTVIDRTFDMMPATPRVLRRCADLAFQQVDVSAIAFAWLSAEHGESDRLSKELRLLAPNRTFRSQVMRCHEQAAAFPGTRALGTAGSSGPTTRSRARSMAARFRASLGVLMLLMIAVLVAGMTAVAEPSVLLALATAVPALAGIAVTTTSLRLRGRATDDMMRLLLRTARSRRKKKGKAGVG